MAQINARVVSVDMNVLEQKIGVTIKNLRSRVYPRLANRMLKFLRNRYISLSSSSGTWPPLAQSTIERKTRRRVAKNPAWILREGDELLNSMQKRITRGGFEVGYLYNLPHWRSKKGTQSLAILHASQGRNPIAAPTQRIIAQMKKIIKDEIVRTMNK